MLSLSWFSINSTRILHADQHLPYLFQTVTASTLLFRTKGNIPFVLQLQRPNRWNTENDALILPVWVCMIQIKYCLLHTPQRRRTNTTIGLLNRIRMRKKLSPDSLLVLCEPSRHHEALPAMPFPLTVGKVALACEFG